MKYTFRKLSLIIITIILTSCFFSWFVFAQNPCPNNPPTFDPDSHLPPGATVYYKFAANITADQKAQILQSINGWSNGTGVEFIEGDKPVEEEDIPPPPATTLFFQNLDLMDQNTGGPNYATRARFVPTAQDSNGNITSATILFNTNATANSITAGDPYYNPSKPGYNSVYRKKTNHEIGHLFGLNHPALPQIRP